LISLWQISLGLSVPAIRPVSASVSSSRQIFSSFLKILSTWLFSSALSSVSLLYPSCLASLFQVSPCSSARVIPPVPELGFFWQPGLWWIPEKDFSSPQALPSLSLWKADVSWPCAFVSSPASALLRASEKPPSAVLRRPEYERRAS